MVLLRYLTASSSEADLINRSFVVALAGQLRQVQDHGLEEKGQASVWCRALAKPWFTGLLVLGPGDG